MDLSGFNIETMNDETLNYLLSKVSKEIETRRNKDKERKWNAVISAIKEYCHIYGSIEVHGCCEEILINENVDFAGIGVIIER